MDSLRASPVPCDLIRQGRTVALIMALAGLSAAMAQDIDNLDITSQGRTYQIHMTFDVAAPVDSVMAVLTDYGFPDRLNPNVSKREVVSRQENITRVLTEIRSCILFYCKDISMIQDVAIVANTIRADIVPGKSDFRSGYFHWTVSSSRSDGAHIETEAASE